MAEKRIKDLTALTIASLSDVLAIEDIANDETKKITVENLLETIFDAIPKTPVGLVTPFAGAIVPDGWLLCDGALLNFEDNPEYTDLYNVIGQRYGGVNWNEFNVPDIKGREIAGFDSSQTEFDDIGKTGGAKTHTLTIAEMPGHRHRIVAHAAAANNSGPASRSLSGAGIYRALAGDVQMHADSITYEGGDGAHNNLQPYITMHYIIKY